MDLMMKVLKLAVTKQASDIHLTAGSPPVLRINGSIFKINNPPLTSEEVKNLCYSLISDEQKSDFESKNHLDFSFFVKNIGRFRGTLFFQKACVSGVLRLLNSGATGLEELCLPETIGELINYPQGLVLVTGPTGSGKSTTLAALVNKINETRRSHILTIEDPIEIVHSHKNSIVNQREIGVDCQSFSDGLKNALRADPDVCLVGEMRDQETIESTLKLAETGHLVFSTLHTNTSAKSIDRIVGAFKSDDREMIQDQLSTVLQAIVSQRLIPSLNGGRKVATEIMIATPAIRNLIREGKIFSIYSVIQTSVDQGMSTLNQSLVQLIEQGDISSQEAFKVSTEREELYQLLKKKRLAS